MEEQFSTLMADGLLIAVLSLLTAQGWIDSSEKIRDLRHDQIFFDVSFTRYLTFLALAITLIMDWIKNGFLSMLLLLGIIILAYFVCKIIGYVLGFVWGYYGFSIIIQMVCLVVSIVFLLILVF